MLFQDQRLARYRKHAEIEGSDPDPANRSSLVLLFPTGNTPEAIGQKVNKGAHTGRKMPGRGIDGVGGQLPPTEIGENFNKRSIPQALVNDKPRHDNNTFTRDSSITQKITVR